MKRVISLLALGLVLSMSAMAQKRAVENPPVDFSNTGIYRIERIDVDDASTRVRMLVEFIPRWWVNFPKETFLEDEATGERYSITGMEGGKIGQPIVTPASGDTTVVLIFPPLPETVKKVNYVEGNNPYIYGIALEKPRERQRGPVSAIPADVEKWMRSQLGEYVQAGIKPFDAPDFFGNGTARVVGYIRGYDPRAGFVTGMVHMQNIITRESNPVAFEIGADGRFVADIPLSHPQTVRLFFKNHVFPIYLEQGSVQGMVLDWEDFLLADRYRNRSHKFDKTIRLGSLADLNRDLWSFKPQRFERDSYQRMQAQTAAMTPMEVVAFFRGVRDRNLAALEGIRGTISDDAYRLLQFAEYDYFGERLGDYEMNYSHSRREDPAKPELPLEFYGYLKEIPLNDPGMLTTGSWVFMNRFEYMEPFMQAKMLAMQGMTAKYPSFSDYLKQDRDVVFSEEDLEYLALVDSRDALLQAGETPDDRLQETIEQKAEVFFSKYENKLNEFSQYISSLRPTADKYLPEVFRVQDSIYYQGLGMGPGLFYDITKVRSIQSQQGLDIPDRMTMSRVVSDAVHHPFLKDEVWRLFEQSLPKAEQANGAELPAGRATDAFRAIVDRFKGDLVLVDFWATSCGPCIANIRSSKDERKKLEAGDKLTYVFITNDSQSPLKTYDDFVKDQELTNTFSVSDDQWNMFMQLFRFSGIPRYILVGKDGRVLDGDFKPYNLEEELRKYE